jgi:hypothetical protein
MDTAQKPGTPASDVDKDPILLTVDEPIVLTVVGNRSTGPRRESPLPVSTPQYRAVSVLAVLSIACAIATVTMFFTLWMVVFPLAALCLGYKALSQIDRKPEVYTGRAIAKAGMWLGAALGLFFGGWDLFIRSAVPHGYQLLDYSILEPDPNSQGRGPNAAQELSNNKTRVFVRGYMLPPPRGQWTGLTKFSICRNSDMCKFGMNLARPEDQIHIELTGDRTMKYTSSEIGVGGAFSVEPDQSPQPYYLIKADYP